jgi:predicted DNA-binding protein (MmcQ/YjbR family)
VMRRAWDAEATWIYLAVPTLAKLHAGQELTADQWRSAMVNEMAPFYVKTENYRVTGTQAHPDPVKDASPETIQQALADYAQRHHVSVEQAEKVDPAVVLGKFYFRTFETASQELSKLRGQPYPVLLVRTREHAKALAQLRKTQRANPFLELASHLDKVVWAFARTDRQLAAMATVEAIRSYAAANAKKLPGKLDDIFETPVPMNPATGKAFEYKLDNDTAVLSDSQSQATLNYTIKIRK